MSATQSQRPTTAKLTSTARLASTAKQASSAKLGCHSVQHPSRQTSHPACSIRQRNARIERYQQLVQPIARHYQRHSAEALDDLIQVGLLGLLRAAELYRSEALTPFEAFAKPHIRGAILHYLRDQSSLVRLPRRLDEQRQRLARLRQLNPQLTNAEDLRVALGLKTGQWERLLASNACRRPLSLDQALEDQLGTAPLVADSQSQELEGWMEPDPLQVLKLLEEEQRQVVERVVLAGWSYRRTGTALAISPMTVRRRLLRGLDQLRELLNPAAAPGPAPSGAPAC
jgi:RNA polymerase sigma-B factor